MTLVAILTVRRHALAQFRAFEAQAARVMAAHGGRIERTVVVDPAGTPEEIKEIHVIRFPDAQAFSAYRKDGRLAEHAHLREQSVLHTEILIGENGPDYHAAI